MRNGNRWVENTNLAGVNDCTQGATAATMLEVTFFGLICWPRPCFPGFYFFACCMVPLGTISPRSGFLPSNHGMQVLVGSQKRVPLSDRHQLRTRHSRRSENCGEAIRPATVNNTVATFAQASVSPPNTGIQIRAPGENSTLI